MSVSRNHSQSSLRNESILIDDVQDDNTDSINWQTSNSVTELEQTDNHVDCVTSSSESVKEISTVMSMDSMEIPSFSKILTDDEAITRDSISKFSDFVINPSLMDMIPERLSEPDVLPQVLENQPLSKGCYARFKDQILRPFIGDKNELKPDISKYFRITTNTVTVLSPQEPWPKDVQLFQPYEVEQILLPDNANCLAVQTFLKMCQLEYKVEARANADAMSPTGRVPFIRCGNFIVSELEGIVQFVGSKGISLTNELDPENKADMRAYMTLVNNVLGNAELYLCWCDGETYNEVTKPRYGSVYPWPLNCIQTWSKRQEETKRLKVIGWYQKSLEEVYNDVETCCQALTDRLDNNQYFFGTKPTELEALIFGHLYTILTTPLPNAALANIVKNFPKLIDLITRLEKQFFQRETQH